MGVAAEVTATGPDSIGDAAIGDESDTSGATSAGCESAST